MALRYHIFAGTNAQARHLASIMCMEPGEWRYVHSEEGLIGLRGGVVLCYGTWKDFPDKDKVLTRAKINEMHIFEVS